MGLAALNPVSMLRGAIRGLLAPVAETAALDAVGRIAPEVRAIGVEVRATRSEIAELRALHGFVQDAPGYPNATDAGKPIWPKDRRGLRDHMRPGKEPAGEHRGGSVDRRFAPVPPDERRLGPYEPRHAYAPDQR